MDKQQKPRLKNKILVIGSIILFSLILLQAKQVELANPAVTGDIKAPAQVKAILKRACYDCHSNETNLRWYDKIAPVSWEVAAHVKDGRKVLNFSNWDSLAPADQKAKLWESVNQILAGAMPIKSYATVHPGAKVSAADLSVLKQYLSGMVKAPVPDTAKTNALTRQYSQWQAQSAEKQDPQLSSGAKRAASTSTQPHIPTSINGIEYIPDYKNWQVVTTSDRFDNGTMRVVFGNDIAIKAIKENHINPWPKGTIFAKVAWDKITDSKGNITTGAFKQVEYMIKDKDKYKSTAGWGFARFKTPKFLPYGKTKLFATECVNCHRPMEKNDFVFTLPVKQ
jgi:hypothetical protein